jgi:hypothetical protein
MRSALCGGLTVLALALGLGCGREPAQEPEDEPAGPAWFEDVTDRMGLDFVHDPGPTGDYFMPQCVGSGLALCDFDGDGRLDLYLVQNAGPKSKSVNRLYRQTPAGKFEDVSAGSGVDVAGHGMGAAVGDVDNDGKPDLLLTEYGRIRLFLNRGGCRFVDVTAESGLNNRQWGTSAVFFDYDRDGRLDLFVANYVDYDPSWPCASPSGLRDYCAPKVFQGTASKLFHNLGPRPGQSVAFEDVSLASGIGTVPGPGLGVVAADFDGDGWPDLFVANDGKPNRLWVNRKNGTFADEAVSRGVGYTQMGHAYAGMGVALGDVDNDGLLDLYVTHLTSETNTLWKQGPRGLFRDRTADWGLTQTRWRGTGFGTLVADFDHDGLPDLAVVNGRVQRGGTGRDTGLPAFWETYAERNQVFAGAGGGKFRDVPGPFSEPYNVGRGLAVGDVDNDGAPDLVTTAIAGKARVWRNVVPDRGRWLKVRAVDPKLGRDAYGAEVTVVTGQERRLRLVQSGHSYLSASDPVAHFGLGHADHIDAVEVLWPDGTRETFPGGAANRAVELRKGSGSSK